MRILAALVIFSIPLLSQATSLDGVSDVSVSAEVLIHDFANNEVLAVQKWGGKNVSVGGTVERVGIDPDGDPYLILRGMRNVRGHITRGEIYCKFSERSNNQVAKLQHGAAIAVHGTVGTQARGRNVVLKDCSL